MSPYVGHNGYSLPMPGLEAGFNDHALAPAIVLHRAPYISADTAQQRGRIGRSWGCPAVRTVAAHRLIDTLQEGQLVFSYYPDARWLSSSAYLNCGSATNKPSAERRSHARGFSI